MDYICNSVSLQTLVSAAQAVFLLQYGQTNKQATHPFNGPLSRTTWVNRYQKGKTNLDFTEARDSGWHWHQLGHRPMLAAWRSA